MAVYERIWRRYDGGLTPLRWRAGVVTKYALGEAFSSGLINIILIDHKLEFMAIIGRQNGFCCSAHQQFLLHSIGDQVSDTDNLQTVLKGKFFKLGHSSHSPIIVHDLADDSCRL